MQPATRPVGVLPSSVAPERSRQDTGGARFWLLDDRTFGSRFNDRPFTLAMSCVNYLTGMQKARPRGNSSYSRICSRINLYSLRFLG